MPIHPWHLLLFVFLFPWPHLLSAQPAGYATLTGHVRDAETGHALEGVHVFIAASMIGTVTDREGRYRLERVPLGAHKLYVSMIGFDVETRDIHLTEPGEQTYAFSLQPAVLEVGSITVEDRRDRRWLRRLKKFERLFLGETANAAHTRIENPEVLDFEGGLGKLAAHAVEPLRIENRALGYRIQYFLKEFVSTGSVIRYDGEPLFEELTPESPEQAALWEANRRRAYYGSFRHFMLALLSKTCREEGFLTYIRPMGGALEIGRDRYPLPPRHLLSKEATDSLHTLRFSGHVEIVYMHEQEEAGFVRRYRSSPWGAPESQTSFMRLTNGPTQVDHTGEVLDPYGVTVYGYFAYERVADQLPKEYRPEDERP